MGAESSAARVALWRALHVEHDAPPHVLDDRVGLELLAPDETWRERGDMNPAFTTPFRASIVGRARFVEDLALEAEARGVGQYVILGAGLDTFRQRHPTSRLAVFEIDQPAPQAWKGDRLTQLGYPAPHFVPVDFEAGDDWLEKLREAGFDAQQPTVVASTGVSMYLTREANLTTLRQVASLAPGTTFAMSFLLPLELAEPSATAGIRQSEQGARASGTPFISFFKPEDLLALAREAGFREVQHVPAETLAGRYFAGRPDGLRPPANAEEFLVARV